MPCLAQYSKDSLWYRAIVKSIDISSASVYFVDYGNMDTVSLANIKKIDPEFLDLPAQAVQCQLFCPGKSWTADDSDALYDWLNTARNLEVEFVSAESDVNSVLIRERSSDPTESDYINARFTSDEYLIAPANTTIYCRTFR